MNKEIIYTLSPGNKLKLINYMEGLPYDVKNFLKGRINDKEFDPSLFRGETRVLHNLTTISRYMDKKHVKYTNNPSESFYQAEYCKVLAKITDKRLPVNNFIRQRLVKLLDMDFYDNDTLIATELAIVDIISEMKKEYMHLTSPDSETISYSIIPEIAQLINIDIMGYKYKSYDFYNYILYSNYLDLGEKDYNHMYNLYSMINNVMSSDDGAITVNDLSVLLYIYFNDIGMHKVIGKYHLLDRFEMGLRYLNHSDSFIADVNDHVIKMADNGLNIKVMDLSKTLINQDKIQNLLNTPDKANTSNQTTPDIMAIAGYIFTFKNINSFDAEEINQLAIKLRGIPKNEITHFMNGIDLKYITFELSENDYGHLKNIDNLQIGTIYDELEKTLKYIAYYDGKFYLLFKDRFNSRTVYGISVDKIFNGGNELARNILTVEESKQYYYSFIHKY